MRRTVKSSILFLSVLSFMTSAEAQETISTTVNPSTQETTITQTNPATQETTVTQTNPNTQETTITKTNANTQETTTTIITPVPAPQSVVATPTGYTGCFTVAAGWNKNIWVAEHSVCQYDSAQTEGVAWISGHWVCTQYKASVGACTKWEWKAGRWVKTLEVY